MQTKIAVYQKEVKAREQEISQLKKELNALENEMCAFRDQNKGLDTVIKKVQRNLSDCEMECGPQSFSFPSLESNHILLRYCIYNTQTLLAEDSTDKTHT